MKWPASLMLIRHDVSAFNELRGKKAGDPLYQKFCREFGKNPESKETMRLARTLHKKYALGVGDAETPLGYGEGRKALETGRELSSGVVPDIIFVSPYLRARLTLEQLKSGWEDLAKVPVKSDERIREQEHGLALLYNDWRIFQTFHPDQRRLRMLEASYWYRYPQGENVPDVRARNWMFFDHLIREWAGAHVLVVSHHLNILGIRGNLEGWSEEEFFHHDENEKPINCGVTLYKGYPRKGRNGKLVLEYYNKKLWG